jgi:hypothetical protein
MNIRLCYLALLVLLISCIHEKHENPKFFKFNYDLNDANQKSKFEKWVKLNLTDTLNLAVHKHDDETYSISCGCNGEWGGFVNFVDKRTNKSYKLESTCPKMIDFRDGKYYILSSLAHGGGYTNLKSVVTPNQITDSSGYNTILDTNGIIANLMFPFKDKNYMIYSTDSVTILGILEENKPLKMLDTLLDKPLWSTYGELNEIKNGIYTNKSHYHTTWPYTGQNIKMESLIYVKGDTIVIGYDYKKWYIKAENYPK